MPIQYPTLLNAIIGLSLAVPAAADGPVWRFQPLELPKLDYPGNTFTSPMDINDAGQVTGESGSSQTSIGMHAFLWEPGSIMSDLDAGQWPATAGLKINQFGMMLGDATFCPDQNGSCASQPIILYPDGTIIELEPVWVGYLVIQDINDNGIAIFNRTVNEGSSNIAPRLWSPHNGTQVLPLPGTSFSGYALDVNDNEVAVGYSVGGGYHPHIWTDGTISSLQVENGGDGRAHAINNAGVIVGKSRFNGVYHATRWVGPQAQPERLINDPEALESNASHILEDGTVLGTWENDLNQILAFKIAPDGTVDLYAPPEVGVETLDVIPVAGNPEGWVLCTHVNEFYQVQSVIRIPGEGWVFPNNRLVGPGSHTCEQPIDMNNAGQIITRGAAWTTPAFLEPRPPGDVNGDKMVNVDDMLAVLGSYGICPPHPSRLCDEDVTADGQVNVDDILGVINQWQ
ncbi:MAG: hypothetical protein VX527_08900 [Planctomycetota bacterium]|nr:hypothetical protein [Planctomycetota bacterium]